jgi:hypothetical protein
MEVRVFVQQYLNPEVRFAIAVDVLDIEPLGVLANYSGEARRKEGLEVGAELAF